MSQSHPNFRSFMRRFNVSKPTDMPDIPEEEKTADGSRPASQVKSVKSGKSDKRTSAASVSSTVTDLSTSSTQVPPPPLSIAVPNAQQGDLLFIPPDIQTPTTFGPNDEYTAVPSVITYSSARGRSRISIREATPEEASEPDAFNPSAPGSGAPEYPQIPPPTAGYIPVIPPPPNFQPVRTSQQSSPPPEGLQKVVSPRISQLSQASQSIRTSGSSQSIRTSTTSDTNGESIFEIETRPPQLENTPSSPPRNGTPNSKHSDILSNASTRTPNWPLNGNSSNSRKGLSAAPSMSQMSQMSHTHAPFDATRGSTPRTLPATLPNSESRFSWHVSNTDRARNWFTRWFVEWWLLEILSWCFSAICMIIIAIVLWKYDGKEIPKWRMGITINAFISIFSGFAKSALLLPTAEALGQLKWSWFRRSEKKMMDFEILDSASRGPWGSFVMLARTKGVTLASVGAAIILLSLPLDLFFQQIVTYPSHPVPDPLLNATISRAIHYDPNPERMWINGSVQLLGDNQLDAFTYPYFLGKGIIPGVEFECPTGNCTYDPFHTLGLDFQCKEMPDFLEFGCKNTSAEFLTTVGYHGPRLGPNTTSCGYYLNVPNNPPQLMSGYEVTPNGTVGEVLTTRLFALSDVFTNEAFFGGSVNFKDIKNPVVDFILASTPGSFDGAVANNTPVVTECEIHWVVKLINSTIVADKLTEVALDTLQFPSDLENPWDPLDSDVYLANFSMTLPDPHSVTGPTSTYTMSNVTARQTWQVWAEFAPSTYSRPAADNPVKSGPVVKYFWLANPPQLLTVLTPQLPWDAPRNVSAQMAEAVEVMNQVVRRNTLSLRDRHDVSVGIAWRSVVLVRIRWVWISLPAALLLFSLLFLITTVVRSTREEDKVGIWKTSVLAILFNGLGEDVQNQAGKGHNKMGYTRSRAKELKVHLDDD